MILIILFVLLSIVLLNIVFFKSISMNAIVLLTTITVFGIVMYQRFLLEAFQNDPTSTNIDMNKIKFLNSLITSNNTTQSANGPSKQSGNVKVIEPVDEDISTISSNLETYVSTYSTHSYIGSGSSWLNISPPSPGNNQISMQGHLLTRDFSFNNYPTYNKKNGLFLGENVLNGPHSLNLGITGKSEFTLFLICKHDILHTEHNSTNIFKVFANSNDNNGISLSLKNIKSSGVFQSGTVHIQFDQDTYNGKEEINLDKNLVHLYVITKTPSSISLKIVSSVDSTPNEIIKSKLINQEVLLSNRRMCINCDRHWNGYIKAFGVYGTALSDYDIKELYDHMMLQERSLENVVKQYKRHVKELTKKLDDLKNCPFDASTCTKCISIENWSNPHDIIASSIECKKSISTFCGKNNKDTKCKCWDKSNSSTYNSVHCKSWRSIFENGENVQRPISTNLDAHSLDLIKQKYNLVNASSVKTCPVINKKTQVQPELLTVGLESRKSKPASRIPTHLLDDPEEPSLKGFADWIVHGDDAHHHEHHDHHHDHHQEHHQKQKKQTKAVAKVSVPQHSVSDHSITTPVKPTAKGFMHWLVSWF